MSASHIDPWPVLHACAQAETQRIVGELCRLQRSLEAGDTGNAWDIAEGLRASLVKETPDAP